MGDLATEFNIYSGILKAYTTADGGKRLRTVASSTIKDIAGDTITPAAIRRMADSAKENMTIFLNHSYKVPEDVFGSVEEVTITNRDDYVDLEFDIRLNEANKRAVETYEAISNGTKLGTSIGAKIPDGGARRDKTSGGLIFDDLELKEASIVGIPVNPRSWVSYARKSINGAEIEETEEEETEKAIAEPPAPVEEQVEEEAVEPTGPAADPLPDGENDLTDVIEEGNQDEADALYAELDAAGQLDPNVSMAAMEFDVTKAPLSSAARSKLPDSDFACPEKRKYPIQDKAHIRNALARCADKSNDQCGCDKVRAAASRAGIGSKAVEVIEIAKADEPEPPTAQEVEPTEPETAVAPDAEALKSISDLGEVFGLLKTTMSELVDTRKQLLEMVAEKTKAETERDSAVRGLGQAKEIVDKIADLPVGRRAGFDEGITEFRSKFSGLYSEDFLALLERKNDGA